MPTKPIYGELEYLDVFDNTYTLLKGNNKIAIPSVITDAYWQSQTNFVFYKNFGTIQFVKEKSFWVAKTSIEKIDKEINFEVSYRREKSPINDLLNTGVFSFLKSPYFIDYKKRENDIDKYLNETR